MSKSRFISAEMTAPPLMSARSATVSRTRFPRSKWKSRRLNTTGLSESARAGNARRDRAESSSRSAQRRRRQRELSEEQRDAERLRRRKPSRLARGQDRRRARSRRIRRRERAATVRRETNPRQENSWHQGLSSGRLRRGAPSPW